MEFRLFYQPEGRLRLETEDRCYLEVRPAWAAPLTHPNKFLALVDGKDREIVMIKDLMELPTGIREIIDHELHRRYLTSKVLAVVSAKSEFGATYWTVDTERGRKDFVTMSLQENAQWMGPTQLLLIDTDGNRFEIRDTSALDEVSKKKLFSAV
jgi:hypothetical protein